MAKGTITVRLSEELLETFKAEAQSSGATVSQIVIDAIEAGRKSKGVEELKTKDSEVSPTAPEIVVDEAALSDPPVTLGDLAERVWSLECYLKGSNAALGQLMMQTLRTAAASQFYSKLAVEYLMDLSTFVVTNEIADEETKKRKRFELVKKCREYQQRVLFEPITGPGPMQRDEGLASNQVDSSVQVA